MRYDNAHHHGQICFLRFKKGVRASNIFLFGNERCDYQFVLTYLFCINSVIIPRVDTTNERHARSKEAWGLCFP